MCYIYKMEYYLAIQMNEMPLLELNSQTCYVKETIHEITHFIWSSLYEVSKIGKSSWRESRLVRGLTEWVLTLYYVNYISMKSLRGKLWDITTYLLKWLEWRQITHPCLISRWQSSVLPYTQKVEFQKYSMTNANDFYSPFNSYLVGWNECAHWDTFHSTASLDCILERGQFFSCCHLLFLPTCIFKHYYRKSCSFKLKYTLNTVKFTLLMFLSFWHTHSHITSTIKV